MIKVSFFIAALLFIVLAALSTTVSATVPSNVPCQCTNGATQNAAVTDHCACSGTCNAGFVLPFCNFAPTARVNFAITYRNVSGFAMDDAQKSIQTQFGIDGNDIKWIQRITRFETRRDDIVVQYLITGKYVNQIYTDVWAATRPTYLTTPYLALDMWQLGTVVAEAGIFARHYAKGNVLSTVDVSGSKLNIYDSQFEFLIAALSIILFGAVIEGIINCIFKPKETPEEVQEREEWMAQRQAANPQLQQQEQQQPIGNNANENNSRYPTAGVTAYPTGLDYGQEMKQQPAPVGYDSYNGQNNNNYNVNNNNNNNNDQQYGVAYDNGAQNPLSYEHQDPVACGDSQREEEANRNSPPPPPLAGEHPSYCDPHSYDQNQGEQSPPQYEKPPTPYDQQPPTQYENDGQAQAQYDEKPPTPYDGQAPAQYGNEMSPTQE